jgi:hypothetical protein
MIGAKTVEKAERERGRNQEHTKFYFMGAASILIVHDTGTDFGR